MKVVILAGGLGTRIAEESDIRPKPMVEIGGRPLLWHIMSHYAKFGHNDFIICLGYKGWYIKEYFLNYYFHNCDVSVNLGSGSVEVLDKDKTNNWNVTLVDTGSETMTGGRIARVARYLESSTPFLLTYGDGLADVNIDKLVSHHRDTRASVTLTAVQPPARFGHLELDAKDFVTDFSEKPSGADGWVNGGFFVVEPSVLKYIESDSTVWEKDPLVNLAKRGQLGAYRHHGFWHPVDTLRDKRYMQSLWETGEPPWLPNLK